MGWRGITELSNYYIRLIYRIMIITIARQCGCGAIRVGKLLAEKYGIPLYP